MAAARVMTTAPRTALSAPTAAPRRPAAPAPRVGLVPNAPPAVTLRSNESNGSGERLSPLIRGSIERSFGLDLGATRVRTDATAQATARGFGARAFAFGNQIYLGPGERPTDLGLMAHEAAHVVQQQGGSALQRWQPFGGDHFEVEARRASAAVLGGSPFDVRARTSPRVQPLFGFDPLDFIARQANLIPGFRLFTIVLGVNPVNMSPVDRSAANIMRAAIEFMPGGGLITQALDAYGIIDKVAGWVEQQLKTLGLVGGSIKQALTTFLGSLGLSDIASPGDVWDRAKRIFTEPVDRILGFVKGLVTGILGIIKDAVLMPLAKLAEGTRGWDLLTAVLGKNPITSEPVPRTAETLIPGFLKLIGQEEVWENMKKANALARAWAWFQGAMAALMGFVNQLPTLAVNAFKSLELADIVLLPRAFAKVAAVFGNFIGDFIGWAGEAVWNLLEIVVDSVSPGALGYIKKTGAALKGILKNPLPFVGNLVKAAKLGFLNFADHFGSHLKAGLIDWLTGSLPGVYIPKAFSLGEIVKFVFSVLGLTWQNIRQKLVKVVGETAVKAMETGFDVVKTLVTQGPAAAWDKIKEQLSNLKDMVIGGITDFVIDMVVKKAIPKLIAMFIPGAGFISAILSIYDTVMVFVNKISKIIQVVTGFIDSIVAIAGGAIGAAAGKVESVLAGLLSLAINFLAGFAGLGKVADKLMGVINKVRAPIDKALDWLIGWIVKTAKALFAKAFGKDKDDKRTDAEKKVALDRGVSDAQALVAGKTYTVEEIRQRLPGIKARYRMMVLELRVDTEKPASDVVHVYGQINPEKSGESTEILRTDIPVARQQVQASTPTLSATSWDMSLSATLPDATIIWGIVHVALEGGKPKEKPGPSMVLENRHEHPVTKKPIRLRPQAFSFTRVALELSLAAYKANFGDEPPVLSGGLRQLNLRNFQTEFARAMKRLNNQDAAKQAAIRAISFGRHRIELGYTIFEVTLSSFTRMDLGEGLTKAYVPTVVDVTAKKP